MVLASIFFFDYIIAGIIGLLVGGGAVAAYFIIRGKKKSISMLESDDVDPAKLSKKKTLIRGLRVNALSFSELYEPMYSVSAGRLSKKEAVFSDWCAAVASCDDDTGFKEYFNENFGLYTGVKPDFSIELPEVAEGDKKGAKKVKKLAKKGRKAAKKAEKKYAKSTKPKKFVKAAEKLVKLTFKAGIVREHDIAVIGDETTAEKYEYAGSRSIEADVTYDVLAPYWHLGDEILDKGVIR